MRGLLAFGLVVMLVGGVATGQGDKDDQAKLQGTWAVEKDGKKLEMIFAKDGFTLRFGDEGSFKGTFKVDAKKTPREMDLTVTEAPKFVGMTAKAIYALEGDTLKWCANEPGKDERPKAFPDKEGEGGGHLYFVFKKSK